MLTNDNKTSIYAILLVQSKFIQWSPLDKRKNDQIRQITANLRSVDPDFQFRSAMILVLLFRKAFYEKYMVVAL